MPRPSLLPFPAAGPPRPAATRERSVMAPDPVPYVGLQISVDVDALAVGQQAADIVAAHGAAPPVGLDPPAERHLGHLTPTGPGAQRGRQPLRGYPDLGI